MKSAICSSCWSTLRAICRSIPSRRCAKRIASSSAAFSGWKSGCTRSGRSAEQASMDELESLWQQAKAQERDARRRPRERRLHRTAPLPRHRGVARLRCAAERSLEFYRRRTRPAAHVRGRRQSRRPGDGRVRRRRDGRLRACRFPARAPATFTCTRTCWRCARIIATAASDDV